MPTVDQQLDPQVFASVARFVPEVVMAPRALKPNSMKPAAYLWTSSHTPESRYPSDWMRWCCEEQYGSDVRQISLIDVGTAKVFTIDSYADLEEFMTRAVPLHGMADFRTKFGPSDYDVDWTATTRAWEADALRVTYEGHWATRLTRPFSTYSWDCESTAWVNPPDVRSVTYLPEFVWTEPAYS